MLLPYHVDLDDLDSKVSRKYYLWQFLLFVLDTETINFDCFNKIQNWKFITTNITALLCGPQLRHHSVLNDVDNNFYI